MCCLYLFLRKGFPGNQKKEIGKTMSLSITIHTDFSGHQVFFVHGTLTHFKQGPACIPTVPDHIPDNCCYCMNIGITVVLVFCTREASMAKIYKTGNIWLKKLFSVLDCLSWICLGPAISPFSHHMIHFTSGQVFSEAWQPDGRRTSAWFLKTRCKAVKSF